MWIQTLTPLEEQGLWIPAIVLRCSYAKAVSQCLRDLYPCQWITIFALVIESRVIKKLN